MDILNKSVTPNDIPFQLEDWSKDFSSFPYGSTIGAYPRKYGRVRCQCDFKDHQEAQAAFEQLAKGEATLFDFNFTVMQAGGNRVHVKDCFDLVKFKIIYGDAINVKL